MKRAISILLTLCMIFTLLPFGALAAEDKPDAAEATETSVAVSDETPAEAESVEASPATEPDPTLDQAEAEQETEEHSASREAPRLNAAASLAVDGTYDPDAAIA